MKHLNFIFLVFCTLSVHAQQVVFSESVGTATTSSVPVTLHNFQNQGGTLNLMYDGTAFVNSNSDSQFAYTTASGTGNVIFPSGNSIEFIISNINTTNYSDLKLSFGVFKNREEPDGSEFVVEYSEDGDNWFSIGSPNLPTGMGTIGWYYFSFDILADLSAVENLHLRWTKMTGNFVYRIDDILLEGTLAMAEIFPNPGSIDFDGATVINTTQTTSYTLTASNLQDDVVVTSMNNAFEISLDQNNWTNQFSLPNDGSLLQDQPDTVHVRFNPLNNATGQTIGILRHRTTGGDDLNLEVFAIAVANEPTISAADFIASPVDANSVDLSWTPGNGSRRLVYARMTNAVSVAPNDGSAPLSVNSNFQAAGNQGSNNKIIYDGDGDSTRVFGLTPNATYHFTIYEYNVGTNNSQNYLTSSSMSTSVIMPAAPPGLQITEVSTDYGINFEDDVPLVLNGPYAGGGLSPSDTPGRLHSQSWKLNLGASNSVFGANTNTGVFAGGTNDGSTLDGGVYAFQTDDENIALGVLPSSSPDIFFNGGSIDLRAQNKTGVPITEINLSFAYHIRNNGNVSHIYSLSFSEDGENFTSYGAFDLTTPTVADIDPQWKQYLRSIVLTGINIPIDGEMIFRWTGAYAADGSSGGSDAFALDDIHIVVNPTGDVAAPTFSGVAESGILAAPVALRDTLTISGDLQLVDFATLYTGEHALILGADATLSEGDGYVFGNVLSTRDIPADNEETFGGIGLSIQPAQNMGLTAVKRVTGSFKTGTGDVVENESIRRWFEVTPELNENLDATIAFAFRAFESPNFTPNQNNFRLYSRPVGSEDPWTLLPEGTLTGTTYTVSGLQQFSEITGGDHETAPLPLDWVSFVVKHDKGMNQLHWVTANELNTKSFEVEKSYNGREFSTLTSLLARGNQKSQESYNHSDKHDYNGSIYYRIKQVDLDQKFSYSPIQSIHKQMDQALEIYPTLVRDHTFLHANKDMNARIVIINSNGKVVRDFPQQIQAGGQEIKFGELPGGVYLIRAEAGDIQETFKIVIQK